MDSRSSLDSDAFGPPATASTLVNANREEEDPIVSRGQSANDGTNLNSTERLVPDDTVLKTRKGFLKIGTWNVRTLYQAGKIDNCIQEMKRYDMDLVGLAEVRWTESGMLDRDSHVMVFSGGKKHQNGVGILMTKKFYRCLAGYIPISDRVIVAKFQAKPLNMVVVQVYSPTSDHPDEELESFYDDVNKAMKYAKSDDVILVMGDMNAKIGSQAHGDVVGRHGLGERNDRGSRLIGFCENHNLTIMNTFFKQPARRLYTWKSPGDTIRNQIDFIMINSRFKNNVKTTFTYPGADIFSDHVLLIMKLKLRLKLPKKTKKVEHWNLEMLRDDDVRNRYNIEVVNMYNMLRNEAEDQSSMVDDVDNQWNNLKLSIEKGLEEALPKKDRKKHQAWMTDEILDKMDQRRKYKRDGDKDRYNELDREIRADCKRAKEEWYKDRCNEIEELERKHKAMALHQKVKELTDRRRNIKNRSGCIKDKDGELLFEKEKISERWVEYIRTLYSDDNRSELGNEDTDTEEEGPPIMKEEVCNALKSMRDGKACGVDGISTECLKALNDTSVEVLMDLCNKIYQSGYIPEDMMKSIFVTLPKKPNALNCSEHRTISLMSHVMKLLLKIILNRNDHRIEKEISSCQSGFRPGMGTREGIFNIRTIIERFLEKQKTLFICFIDYEKAFDRVYHDGIIDCIGKIDMDGKDKRIIKELYWNQAAVVRLDDGVSDSFPIKRGVRQGCVLSPKLFNLYTEFVFREAEDLSGCVIGGININNLRYADDTALMAESEADLQQIVNSVNTNSEAQGLRMNVKKTKTMVISRMEAPTVKITVNGEILEQVHKFQYLGQIITDDGKCDSEVKARIEIARRRFVGMKDVLVSRQLSLSLRRRLVRCYVMSTLLYAAETWTMNSDLCRRINALEMWIYRRMLKISYEDHISNERVLERVGEKTCYLLSTIKERKMRYFGHIVRANGLQRVLMEGCVAGVRKRGKQRRKWTSDVLDWSGMSYADCVRLAHDRGAWRVLTANLRRGDGTDD